MLHAVYRVGNLDETIEYYKKHFGLKQLRYRDIPEVSTDGSFLWLGKAPLKRTDRELGAGEIHQCLPGVRRRAVQLCSGAHV